MEAVVAAAVSFLGVVFLASFIALMVLCRHKYCNKDMHGDTDEYSRIISPNVISSTVEEATLNDLELNDIITCDDDTIRQLLETEEWAMDAQGLIPHFLAILKKCREVTEKLVAMTMGSEKIHPSQLEDIIHIANRIAPRVDDLMQAMQPPFDSELLEARSAALIFSVSHLALIIKSACRHSGSEEWIDQTLANLDEQMRILRGVTLNPPSQKSSEIDGEISAKNSDEDDREEENQEKDEAEQECSRL